MVWVYLPKRSTVHSKPCGTMRTVLTSTMTPANTRMTVNKVMPPIGSAPLRRCREYKESPAPAPVQAAATLFRPGASMSGVSPTSSFAIDVPGPPRPRPRGEAAAFEQLYRWFERPVFTLALRLTGQREEAQDILQDTMLKLIDRLGEFRGDSPVLGLAAPDRGQRIADAPAPPRPFPGR